MAEPDPSAVTGPSFKILLGGAALLLAAGAAQYANDRGEQAEPNGECTPEGGLGCTGDVILVCTNGEAKPSGVCTGGCTTEAGVTRCLDAEKRLVAPIGALCSDGMGLCGMTPNTMVVCKEGRLVQGAPCPGGCEDYGEQGGLYCLSEDGTLRFPPGFACPQFETPRTYACGEDGKSLLKCVDGLLLRHDVTCAECLQNRRGELVCAGKDGDPIDPGGGGKLIQP